MKQTIEMHKLITGTTGKGVAKRSLSSYANHWGIEIPNGLKNQAQQYFSAREASELLKT